MSLNLRKRGRKHISRRLRKPGSRLCIIKQHCVKVKFLSCILWRRMSLFLGDAHEVFRIPKKLGEKIKCACVRKEEKECTNVARL